MRSVYSLAGAAYKDVVSRPLYYITLIVFALTIYVSQFLTLFAFFKEVHMIREMAIASMSTWGFLIIVIMSGMIVTRELEDRTAILLLAKPIKRGHFLLGKFLGLCMALLTGIIFLMLVFILTLWCRNFVPLGFYYRWLIFIITFGYANDLTVLDSHLLYSAIYDLKISTWEFISYYFLKTDVIFALQGAFLSFLQVAILASVSICFSCFFPMVISAAAITFVYIISNLSNYMQLTIEAGGSKTLTIIAKIIYYLVPNFSYFNLQSYFNEGLFVSIGYMLSVAVYTIIYVSLILIVSGLIFERREIR